MFARKLDVSLGLATTMNKKENGGRRPRTGRRGAKEEVERR